MCFTSLEGLWKSQVRSSAAIQPACSCRLQSELTHAGGTDLLERIERIRDGLLKRKECIETLRESSGSARFKMEITADIS